MVGWEARPCWGGGGSSVLSTSIEQCHIQTFVMAYCGILGDKGVRIRKEGREATVLCASFVAFIGATGARLTGWEGHQRGSTTGMLIVTELSQIKCRVMRYYEGSTTKDNK